jgi:hypothetical protein
MSRLEWEMPSRLLVSSNLKVALLWKMAEAESSFYQVLLDLEVGAQSVLEEVHLLHRKVVALV